MIEPVLLSMRVRSGRPIAVIANTESDSRFLAPFVDLPLRHGLRLLCLVVPVSVPCGLNMSESALRTYDGL